MRKIWIQHYPPDMPAEIDLGEYRSINDIFSESVESFRHNTAYVNMGAYISYERLDQLARDFACYLQSGLGLAKGDRVALMMPNILQYPVCIFGALRAGLTIVNVNPLYTPRELEHQLIDSGATAIVILENFATTLQAVIKVTSVKFVIVTAVGDLLGFPRSLLVNFTVRNIQHRVPKWNISAAVGFTDALKQGARRQFEPVDVQPDDIAFLQYTGGTTGVSKGAMLLHRNMVANVQQAYTWLRPHFHAGQEMIVTALPLYHIFSLTANCLTFLKFGASNILITNPRDIPNFIRQLGRHHFTAITGVNTLFNALLNNPAFADLDFSHLKLALGGGMAVQQAVADRWRRTTGSTLVQAYGLTETSPAVTINPIVGEEFNGTVGLPVPSTEVCVRDNEGRELQPGEVGELFVRGPQVMSGYWNHPDETAMVLGPDGFLATGDIAIIDNNGFVRLVDRKKDMVIISGFNVYPTEIESVVALHPGVLEVGAVGVPDEITGEAVKIFVVRRDPTLTEDNLIRHCRKFLTRYKVPKEIEFRSELPKTNVGKILRRALREGSSTTD
ncbi:MAG: AMP-binding protein [Acidiferrobacterales bacterium]